jgi:hypothetical protein
MKKPAKPRLVMVTWVDSSSHDRWEYGPVEPDLIAIDSVGWLVHRDAKMLILAPNMSRQERVGRCCSMTIPTGCVQKIRRLG